MTSACSRLVTAIIFLLLAANSRAQICSSRNDRLQDVTETKIHPVRLYQGCAQTIEVMTSHGSIKVPAGTRVMQMDQNRVYFHLNGSFYQGSVADSALTGIKNCDRSPSLISAKAFLEEANFALKLMDQFDDKRNPQITAAISELSKNLQKLKLTDEKLTVFSKNWENELRFRTEDRVKRVQHFFSLITQAYNPTLSDKLTLKESTLIVPLSMAWFQSHPDLKIHFQQVWLDSNKDIRIRGGGSGEGVSFYPGSTNEGFSEMQELMRETHTFLQQLGDPHLSKSPEAKWLATTMKLGFEQYRRMIFFSPSTWTNNSQTTPWADYIAVDQNLGGISSDYLMSVLIHELNVNSSNYLVNDTHSPFTANAAIWECVKTNGLKELDRDPITLQRAFGINFQLSFVYLRMMVDNLSKL